MPTFRIIKPSPQLSPFIRYYWILEDNAVAPLSERTLPVGSVQLVFHKAKPLLSVQQARLQPQFFISGQSLGYTDVITTGRLEMIVAVFEPYAAGPFLNTPAGLFCGENIPLEEAESPDFRELADRIANTPGHEQCIGIIEAFLLRRLSAFPEYNLSRMREALKEINAVPRIKISRLSEIACLGKKQFGRLFLEYTGSTPKDLMRIIRMQRALYILQQNTNTPFAALAYECGFSDQSHMIREFRIFSGYTPAEYLAACAPHSDYFSNC